MRINVEPLNAQLANDEHCGKKAGRYDGCPLLEQRPVVINGVIGNIQQRVSNASIQKNCLKQPAVVIMLADAYEPYLVKGNGRFIIKHHQAVLQMGYAIAAQLPLAF